jgi:hypothetical protein
MNELPADATRVLASITSDAMADTAEASQLLDIEVDQFSRAISLVTAIRLFGLEVLKSRQTMAQKDAGHRRRRETHAQCDLRACASPTAQAQRLLDPLGMSLPRHPQWPAAAIEQSRLAGLFESPLPLEGRPPRTTSRRGGPAHGHPSKDPTHQEHSTRRGNSGILVKLHLGSFVETVALNTSSLTDLGPDGQQTLPVNNVLRNEI